MNMEEKEQEGDEKPGRARMNMEEKEQDGEDENREKQR